MSRYIQTEDWEGDYYTPTSTLKRIQRYSGLTFEQILDLPYSYFLLLGRDSWIDSWYQSENGREFLKDLWRLKQTKADLDAVRKFQKERGETLGSAN